EITPTTGLDYRNSGGIASASRRSLSSLLHMRRLPATTHALRSTIDLETFRCATTAARYRQFQRPTAPGNHPVRRSLALSQPYAFLRQPRRTTRADRERHTSRFATHKLPYRTRTD